MASPRPFALTSLLSGLLLGREEETDANLAVRVRGQDPAAFRVLFDRQAPAVWRFLRDLVDDGTFADEGVQETFVRAFDKVGQLRDAERMTPWLLGIARNVAMEHLRARRRDRPKDAQELSHDSDEARWYSAPHVEQNPEALLLGREAESLLSKALLRLSDDRRAALLLRVDHGLGYEEICAVLGWTLPKVKNEIHRARLQLRDELARLHGGGDA